METEEGRKICNEFIIDKSEIKDELQYELSSSKNCRNKKNI